MLLTAYPQFLKPEWFDYDCYLWAAELWYRLVPLVLLLVGTAVLAAEHSRGC